MWRCLLVFGAACNQIYDLQPTRIRDASITELPDGDGDGVVDRDDNCDEMPNVDQANSDGDLHGDACDDCPLVENAQGADADGDGVGDRCDPHPAKAGDCVLLIDTFSDPASFAATWKPTGPGTVTPIAGRIDLAPVPLMPDIELQPIGFDDASDIFVQGTLPETIDQPPTITALLGANKTTAYRCVLGAPNEMSVEGPSTSFPRMVKLVPSTPVTHDYLVRFFTETHPDAQVDILCRVDYGVSLGTGVSRMEPASAGGPLVRAGGGPSTLDAVALLRFQPGKPCPATIYR